MSDAQDKDEKADTTKGGYEKPGVRYTGADLAKDVPLDPELTKLGTGEDLNDVDAQNILNERMGGDKNNNYDTSAGDISEIIVDSLPQGMRTPEVLGMIDLRPYLAALDGKTILHRHHTEGFMSPLLPDRSENIVARTKPYLDSEVTRLKDAGVANPDVFNSTSAGASPLPTTYDKDGKLVTDPAATDAADGTVTDPLTGEEISLDSLNSAAQYSPDDLRYMVQTDQWSLEDAAANEGKASAPALIDTGESINPGKRGGRAGYVPKDRVKKSLTAQEALGYLQSMPPDKIKDMQTKLANAGYYDGLDNGGNYLVGDAHDQNTLIAMRKMLTEAYQSNKPISTLIGERMKSYRMNVRDQRLAGLKQDPGYSRAAANDYAQQVIGRNLQPDELRQVEMYLKSLVRDRASNIGGNETFGRGGQLESDNPRGYDEGDVRAALDQSENFQEDARDMTSRSLDFKLRQLMH